MNIKKCGAHNIIKYSIFNIQSFRPHSGRTEVRIQMLLFSKNAVDGGAAAAHACVDGAEFVQAAFDIFDGRIAFKDGTFKIIFHTGLPLVDW